MMKNQKGMSLVSVMIAIGLTGVLGLVLMELMGQQNKQNQKAVINGETNEIFGQFVQVINQRIPCDATLTALKKGDSFLEFRYTFSTEEEPFAVVGQKFRGTKLILKEMKILTDAEALARGIQPVPKDPSGGTTVSLEVTLERPEGTLGGKVTKKIFDVRVAMGKGEIYVMDDPSVIQAECASDTQNRGCIADFDTGICASTPQNAMVNTGSEWFAYCFDPNPPTPTDDIIVRCSAVN